MIYSVTRVRPGLTGHHPRAFVDRQLVWPIAGAAGLVVAAIVDYRDVLERAPIIYGAVVVGLDAVPSPLGAAAKGSQRWFSVARRDV